VLTILVFVLFFSNSGGFMRSFYTFASVLFVSLLLLPSVNEIFPFYKGENLEKRALEKKPELGNDYFLDYTRKYELYYNDNFGLREWLVRSAGYLKYRFFNSSANPSKVLIGKDDWMFLTGSFYKVTQDLQRTNAYTDEELTQAIAQWQQKIDELKIQNIPFFKAVWPDKHYIYPEKLPYAMKVLSVNAPSRFEQLQKKISLSGAPLHLIDVRAELMALKEKVQIYDKYDSHWNSWGAFVAYTELLNQIHSRIPEVKPIPAEEFIIKWNKRGMGDLALILGLDLPELKPEFILPHDSAQALMITENGFPPQTEIWINERSSTRLTALIYRDSFTTALIPFLTRHFRKMILLRDQNYSHDMVNRTHPDVVIECFASRYFR
jgi:hypothetical protein